MNNTMRKTVETVVEAMPIAFALNERSPGFPRWDAMHRGDGIRVCAGIDEVSVYVFAGRCGYAALKYELRFAAPEGTLSVPASVVIASLRAAIDTAGR